MSLKIYPRKRFGQHWLKDDNVLNQIVGTACLSVTDHVLEIGPGTGNLTAKMLPIVGNLTAVELDRDLCQFLRQRFADSPLQLWEGDVLSYVIPETINKVVANIPYNITGEILQLLLGTISRPARRFTTIVLLVQREIAQRLTTVPGKSAYGALSVRCQYLADCELITEVSPQSFSPPPKVHSAVVRLTPRPPQFQPQNPQWLDRLVRLGFAQKRKMLRNNLQSLVPREHLVQVLEQIGIPQEARAENLSLRQWVQLADQTIGLALS